MPNQFSNEYNKIAHYQTTANEIWEESNGKVTHFISVRYIRYFNGSWFGIKRQELDIKIVSAHPVKGHYIQGLKNMEEAIVPEIYDPSKIDQTVMIESEEAFAMAREIIRKKVSLLNEQWCSHIALECVKI